MCKRLLLTFIFIGVCITAMAEHVLFYGDSMIEFGPWEDSFPKTQITVAGFPGFRIDRISKNDYMLKTLRPKKVFFMAGVNNLFVGSSLERIEEEYREIFEKFKEQKQIYVLSILPVAKWQHVRAKKLKEANALLQSLCEEYGFAYIDLYSHFADSDGSMQKAYVRSDGVHLNDKGYNLWAELIKPLVEEKEQSMTLPTPTPTENF